MPQDSYTIEIETNRFNLSEIKPNFIHALSFGEDFARFLRARLKEQEISVTAPKQEDWGWYLEIFCEDQAYFMSISGHRDEEAEDPNFGDWRLGIIKHRTLKDKLLKKNFLELDEEFITQLRRILAHERDLKIIHMEHE